MRSQVGFQKHHWLALAGIIFVAVAVFLLWGKSAAQQQPAFEVEEQLMARPTLWQAGQLFTVGLSPEGRSLDVKIAGNEALVLGPDRVEVSGRIVPQSGEPRDLGIEWREGRYEISEPVPGDAPLEVEVRDRSTAKSEAFRFEETFENATPLPESGAPPNPKAPDWPR
jgi:hypothetical protein